MAVLNALAHVVVTEGLVDEEYVRERCDRASSKAGRGSSPIRTTRRKQWKQLTGVPAADLRAAARLYATGGNAAIYYGLGVTEHCQGSTIVMGMANLAMATGNIGRDGVGVNPLRGQNNVQGACDMGSFPHEFTGYRHVSDDATREMFEMMWGVELDAEPGLRIPNMLDEAVGGHFLGIYIQGEDIAQSDPNTQHVIAGLEAMECVVVQDLFLNETAKYAHVFLPGASFLEKDGTFTNAERRINRVRKVMPPMAGKEEWLITVELSRAMGYDMSYRDPSNIMDEIARLTPSFAGVSYAKLDELGSVQWPCNDKAPQRHADHACRSLRARQGPFHDHRIHPHRGTHRTALSADPHHGAHIVAIQCRRADAAYREFDMAQRRRAGDPSVRRRKPRHHRWRTGVARQPQRRGFAASRN